MRWYTTADDSSNWAPMAAVVVVLVAAVAGVGFFLMGPMSPNRYQTPDRPVIINQGAPAATPAPPTTIVMPMPGPAGPAGPAGHMGQPGQQGVEGKDGQAAPIASEPPKSEPPPIEPPKTGGGL